KKAGCSKGRSAPPDIVEALTRGLDNEPKQTADFTHELLAEMANVLHHDNRVCLDRSIGGFRLIGRHIEEKCLLGGGETRKINWPKSEWVHLDVRGRQSITPDLFDRSRPNSIACPGDILHSSLRHPDHCWRILVNALCSCGPCWSWRCRGCFWEGAQRGIAVRPSYG